MNTYRAIRPLLFSLDSETSHEFVLACLGAVGRLGPVQQHLTGAIRGPLPQCPVEVMGIRFSNPVGLAAGLDKHARAVDGLAALGFGFLELGTVTPLPQPGNPRPRLFRLNRAQGLINRNGFNSVGLGRFLSNLARHRTAVPIGINIGKNAATPLAGAEADYRAGLRAVYGIADYIAVNLSSPNTPGLRDLQGELALDRLLAGLKAEQTRQADHHGRYTPLAVKISPDLERHDIDRIARTLIRQRMDGVIATNTTITRPSPASSEPASGETGGLSGAPLASLSTDTIARLAQTLDGSLPIIGVGGILSGPDAREKFQAGASLVQLYTGLIYQGPVLIRRILEDLAASLATSPSGFANGTAVHSSDRD